MYNTDTIETQSSKLKACWLYTKMVYMPADSHPPK